MRSPEIWGKRSRNMGKVQGYGEEYRDMGNKAQGYGEGTEIWGKRYRVMGKSTAE